MKKTQAQKAIISYKDEKPCRIVFQDGSVLEFIACFGSSLQAFCFSSVREANKDKKGRKQ